MSAYKLSQYGVLRLADNVGIPNDPSNRDWCQYKDWLALGNIPLPADPVPTPDVQTRRWERYPTIQEQLEALYEARQGNLAKLGTIDRKIAQVNLEIPRKADHENQATAK